MKKLNVTQVLKPWWVRLVPEEFLEKGSIVHSACLSMIQDLPVINNITQINGYIDSFEKWKSLVLEELIDVEPELRDDALGIVGHPDMIIKTKDGIVALVDLKTSEPNMVVRAQLSAYAHLASKKYKIEKNGIVRLYPDGKTAKTHWLNLTDSDWQAFISSLNCYRYFISNSNPKT